MRFAAAISFVPVLRKTIRFRPLIADGVNERASHCGRAADDEDKTTALCTERV
jgi:hypothetical protein